jgi:diguanylate cyclase (GGDEF)-like protein
MESTLSDAMERNRRNGSFVSILLVDIDFFKKINDTFGHNVGDRVLKGLVELITNRSRRLDRMFRIGGEEFLVYLPDTKGAVAVSHAEALRELIAKSALLPDHQVTVSIGVAELAGDPSREAWIKRADEALYRAKRSGRNRVELQPPTPVTEEAVSA